MENTTLIKQAIPNLSELELLGVLEAIAQHVQKENLKHLIAQAFNHTTDEELMHLQDEYNDLETNHNALQEQAIDNLNELKDARTKLAEYEDTFGKIKLLVA